MIPRLCSRYLLLLLATVSVARALSVTGANTTVGVFPFAEREGVLVAAASTLKLEEPGTFSAESWEIEGTLHLPLPGNYFVVSNGPIRFAATGKVVGPAVGTARVTFLHRGEFVGAEVVEGSVTVYNGLTPPAEQPPLLNISTRLTLGPGQTVTSGFVVGGKLPRRVLVRAIGPTLATFGISNALVTPTFTLFRNGVAVRTNSGWSGAPEVAAVFHTVGAFPLSPASKDAADVITLVPGNYTLQVSGGGGEVLVEVYLVD